MKWFGVFKLVQWFWNDPDTAVPFLVWLIAAAIETVIISLVVGVIASKVFDKDFDDWFGGSCIVVGILEFILYIIA